MFHVIFKFFVNLIFMNFWEVTKVNTFRSILINATNQVLINLFCHERDHRSCCLRYCNKSCVQSHVSIDLILLHSLCPETLTASSYIPVTQIIYEVLKHTCCLWDSVIAKIIIYIFYHCVHLGEDPLIHNRKFIIFQSIFCCIKIINVRIKHEECISIPKCSHELTLSFLNGFSVETIRKPRSTVDVEIPADRICTVFLQCIKRINGISFRLTHLLSIFILNMSKNDNILIWSLVEQQC